MARLVQKPEMRVVELSEPERSPAEQLYELFGRREVIAFGRRAVEVHELSIEEIAGVAASVDSLFAALFRGGNINAMIGEQKDAAVLLIVAATGEDEATVRKFAAGAFARVLDASVRMNRDFFVQSAALVETVGALASEMIRGAGPTSSTASQSTDT